MYLSECIKLASKNELPLTLDLLSRNEAREYANQYREKMPKVSAAKKEPLPSVIQVWQRDMPICGILNDVGLPLHPPHKNNKKGRVDVQRHMGGQSPAPNGLISIAQVYGADILKVQHVYTPGTWSGFVTRLQDQMGRNTTSVKQLYMQYFGKQLKQQHLYEELDRYMPRGRSTTRWPELAGDLNEMLANIQITASSSAGAPYWREKGLAMEDILQTGIPTVVRAIMTRKLGALMRENPEMFLCEVKNKTDRYKIDKLNEKTRPYCCIPAHWSFIFSVITQRFQETLEIFDKNFKSSNAYGFSAAHGGLGRMYKWMLSANTRGKVACYGDDTCLVIRRDNKIYRVDPDFKQMDGSIDGDDISLVVDWMLHSLSVEEDGEIPEFWSVVAQVWKDMASDPIFVLDGSNIFKKNRRSGFMSGVPGTTLFTTVKSVLTWNLYLDQCVYDKSDPLNFENVNSFMKKAGLVIKEGTWSPAVVPEVVEEQLLTDHKFLGVQMMCKRYNGRIVIVPTIPESDAIEMLLVQKDDPGKQLRGIPGARTLFDRMRGFFITFGFTIPHIIEAIHNVVNGLDPIAIVMAVQNGDGDKPDHILLSDVSYPDSSGFPTVDFCLALYSEDAEMPVWHKFYPQLEGILDEYKKENRKIERAILGKHILEPILKATEGEPMPAPEENELLAMVPGKREKPSMTEYNPRSHITGRPNLPSLGECIRQHLANEGGVLSVRDLRRVFSMNDALLQRTATDFGLFLTGVRDGDMISLRAIQTPAQTIESGILREADEKSQVVTGKTKYQTTMVKRSDVPAQSFVRTAPGQVKISDLLYAMKSTYKPSGDLDPISTCIQYIIKNTNVRAVSFKTLKTHMDQKDPVEVGLIVTLIGDEPQIEATARSVSSKFAKMYIATALLERWKIPFERDRFTAGTPPPVYEDTIKKGVSWSDSVEKFSENERRVEWSRPSISERQYVKLPPEIADKINEFSGVVDEKNLKTFHSLAEFYLNLGEDQDAVLKRVLDMIPLIMRTEATGSRRSRFTPAKRQSLNRKTLERRKSRSSKSPSLT